MNPNLNPNRPANQPGPRDAMADAQGMPRQATWRDEGTLNAQQLMVDKHLAGASFNFKLATIRAQLPGVSIATFPNMTTTVLLGANVAQDISVRAGCKLAKIASDAVIYVSRNGNANVPVAGAGDHLSGAFIPDRQSYYYVDELQSFSVVSASAANVTVEWFDQL